MMPLASAAQPCSLACLLACLPRTPDPQDLNDVHADAHAMEQFAAERQQALARPALELVLADSLPVEPTTEQVEAMEKAREITGNKWLAYLAAWAGWLAWDLWRQQQQKQGQEAQAGSEAGSAGSTGSSEAGASSGGEAGKPAAGEAGNPSD